MRKRKWGFSFFPFLGKILSYFYLPLKSEEDYSAFEFLIGEWKIGRRIEMKFYFSIFLAGRWTSKNWIILWILFKVAAERILFYRLLIVEIELNLERLKIIQFQIKRDMLQKMFDLTKIINIFFVVQFLFIIIIILENVKWVSFLSLIF